MKPSVEVAAAGEILEAGLFSGKGLGSISKQVDTKHSIPVPQRPARCGSDDGMWVAAAAHACSRISRRHQSAARSYRSGESVLPEARRGDLLALDYGDHPFDTSSKHLHKGI
jgi:hypothetical protein